MKNKDRPQEGLTYERAVYVLKMLEGIPEDIKDIFTPETEDALVDFEINISKFRAREKEREKVMQLQKQYGLPLRPNQSLREVMIRMRIQHFRKKRD